jgi:hypothetical protein
MINDQIVQKTDKKKKEVKFSPDVQEIGDDQVQDLDQDLDDKKTHVDLSDADELKYLEELEKFEQHEKQQHDKNDHEYVEKYSNNYSNNHDDEKVNNDETDAHHQSHNNSTGTNINPETMLEMLDKFLQIYNSKHNAIGSIFEGVDLKDPIATNDRMEMFYEYIQEYQLLYEENPSYIDVYEPNVTIENSDSNDVYALISADGSKITYLSLSFISLLLIGIKSTHHLGKNWSIIKL